VSRAAFWLLSAGVLLFAGVLVSQGLGAVLATLAVAGWGLLLVAAFHLLPLGLDAAAIEVLLRGAGPRTSLLAAALTRWVGESASSLMPAGQLGGPVLMVRKLNHLGRPMQQAVAAITVSTTLQTLAQVVFALAGIALLGERASHVSRDGVRTAILVASAVLAVPIILFYLLQRRGLFSKLIRVGARLSRRDWSGLMARAAAIDAAVAETYSHPGRVRASFGFSLIGWLAGTGEVYLILWLMGSAVDWSDALLLESLGQAIRGAGFAIPASLGIQEGGYLLLGPLVGLRPDVALALSLAKRSRELLLGAPGLVYLHFSERRWRRREPDGAAAQR